jgi:tryptophan-rich sensory protein
MQSALFDGPLSGPAIHRHAAVSPLRSFDSLRGGLLWFGLLLVCLALGGLGLSNAAPFLGPLRLPGGLPATSLFGPVWSVANLLAALAAWGVWRHRHTVRGSSGLALCATLLLLGALWPSLFMEERGGLWALGGIALLWVLAGFTARTFWRVRPAFALLLIPLWAWLSVAAMLNAAVWWAGSPGLSG